MRDRERTIHERSEALATLRCPDDGRPLRFDDVGAVPFAVCDHCSGLWFERNAIERRDNVRAQIPESSARWSRRARRIASRFCPVCREPLKTLTIDGISIDRCLACCGVWLDPGQYDAARIRLKQSAEVPRTTVQTRNFNGLSEIGSVVLELVVAVLIGR